MTPGSRCSADSGHRWRASASATGPLPSQRSPHRLRFNYRRQAQRAEAKLQEAQQTNSGTESLRPAGAPLTDIDPGSILDGLSDAVVAADDVNRIVYVNPSAERLLGWPSDELVGRALVTIIPAELRDAHLAGFARYVMTGEAKILGATLRLPALHRSGAEVPVELTLSAFRVTGDSQVFVASLRDLSELVQLEREKELSGYLRATSELALLLGLRNELSTLTDAAPLVLETIGQSLGWPLGAVWEVDPSSETLACVAVWRSPTLPDVGFDKLSRQARFPRGEGLPGRVWVSGEPAWITDIVEDGNFSRSDIAARQGLHAAFAFPIRTATDVFGVVEFFHTDVRAPDHDVLGVAATLGGNLGLFLQRAQAQQEAARQQRAAEKSYQAAVRLARTLQASLLPPHLPTIENLEVAASYRSLAEEAEVGGDFYDLFLLGDDEWGIVIGDVCGKGAEAAVLTALARYTLRAAAAHSRRPSAVLKELNLAMLRHSETAANGDTDRSDTSFCTACTIRLQLGRGRARVDVSCGGHPPPLVVRANGSTRFLGCGGTLLGMFPTVDLVDEAVELGPGDGLMLYTDGVTEARGSEGLFGQERLAEAVIAAAGGSAVSWVAALEEAVTTYTGGRLRDDVAILAFRLPPL